MKLTAIDHIVITTRDLDRCLHFYVDILGMTLDRAGGRYAVRFGDHKFNIHTEKGEFQPAAAHPTYGSLDLCLITEDDIAGVKAEIEGRGGTVELGPVEWHGARGTMTSLYLRDPDGNLVEISQYR